MKHCPLHVQNPTQHTGTKKNPGAPVSFRHRAPTLGPVLMVRNTLREVTPAF